jgi:hypothetical protein
MGESKNIHRYAATLIDPRLPSCLSGRVGFLLSVWLVFWNCYPTSPSSCAAARTELAGSKTIVAMPDPSCLAG